MFNVNNIRGYIGKKYCFVDHLFSSNYLHIVYICQILRIYFGELNLNKTSLANLFSL